MEIKFEWLVDVRLKADEMEQKHKMLIEIICEKYGFKIELWEGSKNVSAMVTYSELALCNINPMMQKLDDLYNMLFKIEKDEPAPINHEDEKTLHSHIEELVANEGPETLDELILKLKLLAFWDFDFDSWHQHIWPFRPDELICCNGHDCGCKGSTYQEYWEYCLKLRGEDNGKITIRTD